MRGAARSLAENVARRGRHRQRNVPYRSRRLCSYTTGEGGRVRVLRCARATVAADRCKWPRRVGSIGSAGRAGGCRAPTRAECPGWHSAVRSLAKRAHARASLAPRGNGAHGRHASGCMIGRTCAEDRRTVDPALTTIAGIFLFPVRVGIAPGSTLCTPAGDWERQVNRPHGRRADGHARVRARTAHLPTVSGAGNATALAHASAGRGRRRGEWARAIRKPVEHGGHDEHGPGDFSPVRRGTRETAGSLRLTGSLDLKLPRRVLQSLSQRRPCRPGRRQSRAIR